MVHQSANLLQIFSNYRSILHRPPVTKTGELPGFRLKLEKLTLNAAVLTNRFAALIKSTPFSVLPSRTGLMVEDRASRLELGATYLIGLLLLIHSMVQVLSFDRSISYGTVAAETVLHLFFIGFCFMSLLFYWTALENPRGTASCINELANLINEAEGEWVQMLQVK